MKYLFTSIFIFTIFGHWMFGQEIREFMDLQTHPTMSMCYGFFGDGLSYFDEENPPEMSFKHQFSTVNYANYLEYNGGARIIINGAIAPELSNNRKKRKEMILSQIERINQFAKEHKDKFVVAKTPQEVRDYVHNTDKTVIIHSIEGAKRIVESLEDAQFWATQGVAFMTLVHLQDDEYGGAAIRPGMSTALINFKGALKRSFQKKKSRGLTEKGKQAILWLTQAGIMTDLTHMCDETRKDALAFMEEHKIPPIVTHDMFKPIQNHPRGLEEEDVLKVYQCRGFMSLPISGMSTMAFKPEEKYQKQLDSLEHFCAGSIDSYKFTYLALKDFVESHVVEICGETVAFEDLTEAEKLNFAIGFQSDFDGWLNHSRPRYGKKGCFDIEEEEMYEAIELEGLAHPGLLVSQWRLLEKEAVDLSPIKRASEKFLQVWEEVLGKIK